MMSVKVYFGGLTGEASQGEASFRSLLASQGVGVESEAPVNVKSGYAFANYDSMDAANDAIAKFNGTYEKTSRLKYLRKDESYVVVPSLDRRC